jgi:hypothetical protein
MRDKLPAGIDPETGEILPARAAGEAPGAGALRPPGPPAEAVPRLDKRTYLDKEQGKYKASLTDYGDGLCEVGWAFVPNLKPFKVTLRGESESREKNKDRAVRRARSTMRKKILAHGLDHLLTLTYRENVTDFQKASDDLSRFVRGLKKPLPGFHYVAVPERQERGAWHWHLAVKGRQDVDLLRRLWRQVVGEGNIDVQKPKGAQNQRLALVKYLSKYLAKGFELNLRELNGHRFRSSLGMTIPTESIPIPKDGQSTVSVYVVEKLVERSGKVGFAWVNEYGSVGWACSWR